MPAIAELFTFENQHPRHTSHKELLIRDTLGMTVPMYYRELLRAARTVEGVALDPLLCGRINQRHAA